MTRKRSVRPGFEQRLLMNVRACNVSFGDRVVVGFSGGFDSLALATALKRVGPMLDLHVLLVHVDHRLRPDSGDDARRARELAESIGLPIEIKLLDDGLSQRSRGVGVEECARRERYLAIEEAARAFQSTTIMLAHQANDQAETILLHLFRGAGLRGIGGMSPVEWRSIPWWPGPDEASNNYKIVRPILSETRSTIEAYVSEMGFTPTEDPSNLSTVFDRNWVRRQILPLIEERWPSVIETLGRSAGVFRVDDQFLSGVAGRSNANEWKLRRSDILAVDPAIAYRNIRDWLHAIGVEDVGFDVVERSYLLAARNDRTSRIEAGCGIDVVVIDDFLVPLSLAIQDAARFLPIETGLPSPTWHLTIDSKLEHSNCVISVPSGFGPSTRTVSAGDRWFGSARPVSDDLRAANISPHLRDRVLCVSAGEDILLIPAIYPTIRSVIQDGESDRVGVRWWRKE